jgi:uncharacterized membrane protein
MSILVAGLLIFLAVHSVSIFNEPWRDSMVAKLGERRWKSVYSLVAIIGFVLIVWGYSLARVDPVILYSPPTWLRHVSMLILGPVFPLLLASYLPGRIQEMTKHPMLFGIKLWALAHLLANGMLAAVLLFGRFLVWAVIDRISMKRRTQRLIPGAPPSKVNDSMAVLLGLVFYAAFVLWLHTWLIGVSPIAG